MCIYLSEEEERERDKEIEREKRARESVCSRCKERQQVTKLSFKLLRHRLTGRERERERERVGFRSVKLKESAIKSGVCFPSITYNGVSTCQLL
jgi:hypothetical protein